MTAPPELREIPIAGGWDRPESRRVAAVKSLYVADELTLEELERRLEPILLREAPAGHPLPAGWEPLLPCEHEWIDVRTMGDRYPHEMCGRCGVHLG